MEDSTEDKWRASLLQLLIVHHRQTILLAAVHCNAQHEIKQRRLFYSRRCPSLFLQRLQWTNFCELHGHRAEFKRHLRMTHLSFTKLLASLRLQLQVNEDRANQRGGAILPEICLYICIRYLASGSYSDIRFYRLVRLVVLPGSMEDYSCHQQYERRSSCCFTLGHQHSFFH
jgi:hypothetical protein